MQTQTRASFELGTIPPAHTPIRRPDIEDPEIDHNMSGLRHTELGSNSGMDTDMAKTLKPDYRMLLRPCAIIAVALLVGLSGPCGQRAWRP